MTKGPAAADLMREYDYEPLILPALPSTEAVSSGAETEHESAQEAPALWENLAVDAAQSFKAPKRDYAGARTIVSTLRIRPRACRRFAAGFAFASEAGLSATPAEPETLPAAVLPPPVRRNLEHPVAPNPRKPLIVRAIEPRIPNPALPIDLLKCRCFPQDRPYNSSGRRLCNRRPSLPHKWRHEGPRHQRPRKLQSVPNPPDRYHASATRPALNGPKAVAVINAVVVPPELSPVIPDAELTTRFVVAPSPEATAVENTSGAALERQPASRPRVRQETRRTCLSRMGSETKSMRLMRM